MSRLVVTGAAGFIGSHLAERLAADGHDVVGVDSFNDYYDPARKRENAEPLDVLEADLLDVDLDELLAGVDGIYHLAGQPGVRASFGPDFVHYATRNVQASARLFEAAARQGIRVAYASSSSIYGDAESYPTREDARPQPISPYGVTKLCVEHLAYAHARTAGLERRGRPLLHRLRPAAAAGHGVHPPPRGARRGHRLPPLRRRLRLAELHVRRRRGGGDDRRARAWSRG